VRFYDPGWLWALGAVPALAALSWWGVGRGLLALREFVSAPLLPKIVNERVITARKRRTAVLAVAVCLLIIAMARPQYGVKPVLVKRAGIDVMILLDVSKSMAATDVKPSRIERARAEVDEKLIQALEGNRIGLIAFAGASFIECPLTLDASAVRMILASVDAGSIPAPGTNIGAAIEAAVKAFEKSRAKTKAAIVITDGENLEGDVDAAVEKAVDAGLVIFTVGIGSEAGAPVPELDDSGAVVGYKTDEKGATVITRLDAGSLRRIAETGGGEFYVSRGRSLDLSDLVGRLKKMEKTDITSREFTEYEDRYQPLVLAALLLLAAEFAFFWRASGEEDAARRA